LTETIYDVTIEYSDWWNPAYPTVMPQSNFYTNYTWPVTVYMYQMRCPSCKKMNWGQLDITIECKNTKCKAKLRAVSAKEVPDHIIEIET